MPETAGVVLMLVRVTIAIVLLLLPTALQAQDKRIALLIGNQGYGSEIGRLPIRTMTLLCRRNR
jgi:hypothetical protein